MVDLERRALLVGAAATVAALRLGATALAAPSRRRRCRPTPSPRAWPAATPPPTASSLWTRLAPDPPNGGGMPPDPVSVTWEVAADEAFSAIVPTGTVNAVAELAHTVARRGGGPRPRHRLLVPVRRGGLDEPGGPVAHARRRARLTPCGSASCPARATPAGTTPPWPGWRPRTATSGSTWATTSTRTPAAARRGRHGPDECTTLEQYRHRYALYKTDPDLQAAHHAAPVVAVWDDHEVDNNYEVVDAGPPGGRLPRLVRAPAGAAAGADRAEPADLPRLPVGRPGHLPHARRAPVPRPGAVRRRARRLPGAARRGPHDARGRAAGLARRPACAARRPCGTSSASRPCSAPCPSEASYNNDQWDGYPQQRDRVWALLRERPNPVIVTGDIHAAGVAGLHQTLGDVGTPRIGTELVGTSDLVAVRPGAHRRRRGDHQRTPVHRVRQRRGPGLHGRRPHPRPDAGHLQGGEHDRQPGGHRLGRLCRRRPGPHGHHRPTSPTGHPGARRRVVHRLTSHRGLVARASSPDGSQVAGAKGDRYSRTSTPSRRGVEQSGSSSGS